MNRHLLAWTIVACMSLTPACAPQIESGVTSSGLYFESVGRGPPVIMLHGFSLDRRMWDDQVEYLRDSHRIVRYDLRGHGNSAPPDAPFAAYQDLLEVFEAAYLVDRAVLVGLSAGAEVATDFALTFPERVRGLLLASPGLSGYVPQGSFDWMSGVGEALREGNAQLAAERWMETPLMAIGEPRADSVMRRIVRSNADIWTYPQDVRIPFTPPAVDRLAQLSVNTLVVIGESDFEDTHSIASLIVNDAPKARVQRIPAAGHLVNLAAPDVFNRIVLGFLQSNN